MGYRIEFTKRAEKQLAKLNTKTQQLIANFVDNTLNGCSNPRALPNAKKLQGVKDGWRWRVGVYRILGIIDDDRIIIEIFRIGHRRDVYQKL